MEPAASGIYLIAMQLIKSHRVKPCETYLFHEVRRLLVPEHLTPAASLLDATRSSSHEY